MIAGMLYWNQDISDAFAEFPDSGCSVYRERGLVMSSRSPENLAISQDGAVCSWDGDLHADNGARRTSVEQSPAARALEIAGNQGLAGLVGLIGDWSLAIWSGKDRALLLATDYAGVRPVYFRHAAGYVRWSSSLSELVKSCGAWELDDDYIGDFLISGTGGKRTPFRDIHVAPAGGFVRFSSKGLETGEFWRPPAGPTLDYRDERDYEAHLVSLFEESVRSRMRCAAPVAAELSGGLDSSSIVCMANALMRGGRTPSPKLITFSYRQPGSRDARFIDSVERHCGLSGIHLQVDGEAVLSNEMLPRGAPLFWGPRFERVAQCMKAAGSSTLMTGQFGDLIMGNSQDPTAAVLEHVMRVRPKSAIREAFAWSTVLGVPVYSVLRGAIKELLGGSCNGQADGMDGVDESPWRMLTPAFRRRLKCSGAFKPLPDGRLREVSPERRPLFRNVMGFLASRRLQRPEPLLEISYTHPFAHRPLVEFMLSLPPRVVWRAGAPRRLMRQALRKLLPSDIQQRQSKASYQSVYLAAVRPLAADMLRLPSAILLVKLGYLDQPALLSRLERMVKGLECGQAQLRSVILLEYWLRATKNF